MVIHSIQFVKSVQNVFKWFGHWNLVCLTRLHAVSRNRPEVLLPVDFLSPCRRHRTHPYEGHHQNLHRKTKDKCCIGIVALQVLKELRQLLPLQ